MALIRPWTSIRKLLIDSMHKVHRPSFRRVSLSSKEVKPITITQARQYLKDMVGTFYKAEEGGFVLSKGEDMLPIKASQADCPVRRMRDSYQEAVIPLGQDPEETDKYISFLRGLRFGRILEDLDTFAVWICYIHNQDPSQDRFMKSPLSTVTALVDRIDLHDQAGAISPFKDVKMCGHVTWVGTSSMEVTMTVEQEVEGRMQQMLTARFVMVARNPETKQPAVVNPLQPEGDHEWTMYNLGQKNKSLRQEKASTSLLKTAPSEEERHLIHDIFLQTIDPKSGTFSTRVKPDNSVWMEETKLKNLAICHPEQRNLYNKIFGGYLMRQAFELAWVNAAIFCKQRPMVRVVDDIMFRKPVEIGSLLFFSSQVVYTEGSLMQVKVHAEVLDILTKSRDTTNEFYFVFDSNQPDLPRVVPRTYSESMLHLDGKRHMKD